MRTNIFVSIIVTTYNWTQALHKVLQALQQQTDKDFEIIIADDGSQADTKTLIEKFQSDYCMPHAHIWQPDEGFQAAKIRNKAVAMARGDYLVFLDGDCIPLKHFVSRHKKYAEEGWLLAGNRILLSEFFTQQVLNDEKDLLNMNLFSFLNVRRKGDCNRILPLLNLPIPRKLAASSWKSVKTCNLGVWKEDFLSVNGFDENYQGWGYEDSDLIIRLFKKGIRKKSGRFAIPILHLWHKESDRSQTNENYLRLQSRLKNPESWVQVGINQYLGK